MEIIRTSGVASYAVVPLIDAADNKSYKASPTLAAGDVKVIRHTGGAWNYSNIGTLPAIIGGSATKQILVTLTATELTSDNLDYPIIVQFVDQTATKEWEDQQIDIWTKAVPVNMTQIDGNATSGNNATLNLKQLNIVNSSGTAIIATGGGASGHGMLLTAGTTTANGLKILGGSSNGAGVVVSATSGDGMNIAAGGGSGVGLQLSGIAGSPGMSIVGGPTGIGLDISGGVQGMRVIGGSNYNAVEFTGVGSGAGFKCTGGATGVGFKVLGGATSGDAVQFTAQGGGSNGFTITAHTTGHGIATNQIYVYNVSSGGVASIDAGIYCESVNGDGIHSLGGTSNSGIRLRGGNSGGAGLYCDSVIGGGNGAVFVGRTTYAGIAITGGSTSGPGMTITGSGTGNGLVLAKGGTGTYDLQAAEIQAIKTQTDKMAFTVTNQIDCNVLDWKSATAPAMTGDAYAIVKSGGAGDCAAIKTQTDKMTFDVSSNILSVKNATTLGVADFNATEKASIGTAVAGSGVTLADGSITAAKFAAGAVDANAFDQTAANKVWATTSRTITDKAGYALTSAYDPAKTAAQASALATTDGKVDLVKAKTDQLIFTGGAVDSNVASIETDALSAAAVSAAAVTKIQDGLALVADVEAVGVAVGAVDSHLSAVGANVQSVVDVLPSGGVEISKFALTDELDTVAVSEIFELVLCMVTGRFKKDYPTAGDLTFYKQDNLTVLKLMHVTETERTRI